MNNAARMFVYSQAPEGSANPFLSGFIAIVKALLTDQVYRAEVADLILKVSTGQYAAAIGESIMLATQLIAILNGQTPTPVPVPVPTPAPVTGI